MKRFLHFFFISLLVVFLTACNIQTVEKFEQMQDEERSMETQPSPGQPEVEEQTPSVENEIAEEEQEVQEPEVDKKIQVEEQKEEPRQRVEKQAVPPPAPNIKTEQPMVQKGDHQPTTVTPSAEESKPQATEKQQQPAPKKRTVTIAIRVDTLLKHWDKLDPALQSEKYVPKNGVILKSTTYELLSEHDTVWDVLQRATKEHKIQMEYQGANENMYNSVYVEGINHLYEFSAGELSGWMYKVNGVYPNYGCSQYVLKDGDVIEWNYTVDLGRDLGHYWDGE
ncbi:DUF4430 domain-containing protein [Lysinibacillus macroides]|uniref:DUF4430 domain-containing protein n=1 Tax=Lysinibacillus macroides TaxID=33935 RepID=UPI0006B4E6CE|nr:DUF4430 domain-containing protein [Lysinibacillus macroides]QPR68877.1 DUF4430 domain-containing protein [Lysinibacillus macroides]